MRCARCKQAIETDAPANAVICDSCADELRSEQDALTAQAEAEAEAMDRAAYEEAQHDAHFDTGNGYRYI